MLVIKYVMGKNNNYKPLPDNITIIPSKIDGLGLFTTEKINSRVTLGVSHISDDRFENGFIRTPLGGFINHSNEPNCILYKGDHHCDFLYLITIKEIEKNEELTVKYSLYDPTTFI